MSFDNRQSGSSLLGSDKHWANTNYGVVFELVVLGKFANPIILLDEIDKAVKANDLDPLASLHTLLEPITSQRVCDLSLDFEFDASHVIWIATANDLTRVAPSLRSRFKEFWIEQPTGAQALKMAEVIVQEVHKELDVQGFQVPGKEFVRHLAPFSAREQTQALRQAYAAALVCGRDQLLLGDLPEEVRLEASEGANGQPPSGGWVH